VIVVGTCVSAVKTAHEEEAAAALVPRCGYWRAGGRRWVGGFARPGAASAPVPSAR